MVAGSGERAGRMCPSRVTRAGTVSPVAPVVRSVARRCEGAVVAGGGAGAAPGRRRVRMDHKLDGWRTAICLPPRPAASSSNGSLLAFPLRVPPRFVFYGNTNIMLAAIKQIGLMSGLQTTNSASLAASSALIEQVRYGSTVSIAKCLKTQSIVLHFN